jgi:hypothetical protein
MAEASKRTRSGRNPMISPMALGADAEPMISMLPVEQEAAPVHHDKVERRSV